MPIVSLGRTRVESGGGTSVILAQQGRTAAYAAPTGAADAVVAAVPFDVDTNRQIITERNRYIPRIYNVSRLDYRPRSPGLENATISETVDRQRTQPGPTDANGDIVLINVQQGLEPWLQTLTGDKTPDVSTVGTNSLRYTFTPANNPLPGLTAELVRGTIPDRTFGLQVNQLSFNLARSELSAFTMNCVGLDYQLNTAGDTDAAGTPVPAAPTPLPASTQQLATGLDVTGPGIGADDFADITSGRNGKVTFTGTGLARSDSNTPGRIIVSGTDEDGNAIQDILIFTSATATASVTTENDYATITGGMTTSGFSAGTVTMTIALNAVLGNRAIPTVDAMDRTGFVRNPARGYAGWAARLLNSNGELLGGSQATFTYNNNFSVPDDLIGTQGGSRVTRGNNFRELSLQMTLPYSRENLTLAYDFQENTTGGAMTIEYRFQRAGQDDSRLAFIVGDIAFEEIPLPAVESAGEINNQINLRLLNEEGQNNIISIEYDTPLASAIQLQQYS